MDPYTATKVVNVSEGVELSDEPKSASTRQEDEKIYIEHVRLTDGDGASYEPLRKALVEKLYRGWLLLSMVKDPAGDRVRLVWETRGRYEDRRTQD